MPATLQATIGARIDRLTAPAKRVLNAAAVIGSRFGTDLLAIVLGDGDESGQAALAELVHSELIDQVMFSPRTEYAFRHPLVRTVRTNLSSGLRVHNFTVVSPQPSSAATQRRLTKTRQ